MIQSTFFSSCRTFYSTCRESPSGRVVAEVVKVAAAVFSLYLLSSAVFSQRLLNLSLPGSSHMTIYAFLALLPAMEEILFTGVLQESFRSIQSFYYRRCMTPLRSCFEMHGIVRVFATSMTFSFTHLLLLGDRSLIRFTFRLANQMTRGIIKEKYQTLFTTIVSHGIHNIVLLASIAYPSTSRLCYGILTLNCLAMGILAFQ